MKIGQNVWVKVVDINKEVAGFIVNICSANEYIVWVEAQRIEGHPNPIAGGMLKVRSEFLSERN